MTSARALVIAAALLATASIDRAALALVPSGYSPMKRATGGLTGSWKVTFTEIDGTPYPIDEELYWKFDGKALQVHGEGGFEGTPSPYDAQTIDANTIELTFDHDSKATVKIGPTDSLKANEMTVGWESSGAVVHFERAP